MSTDETPSKRTKDPSSGASKPSRVRTYTRPRAFPSSVRHKLSLLGHPPPTKETSRSNLNYLVDRLTADLNNYRSLADHWQTKYNDLESSINEEKADLMRLEASLKPIESFVVFNPNSRHSNDDLLSYTAHTMGRLHSTANPSLSLVEIGAPKINSNVSRLVGDSSFYTILAAIDIMAALNYVPPTAEIPYPNLTLLKSDFNIPKALQIWRDAFAPMNFHPSKLNFITSSSCRRDFDQDLFDSDSDLFDLVLAQSSDLEIIEMLHYITIFITGMHQAVFDDPSMAPARLHLGKSCERLLREAIFTRNLTSNRFVAQGLMDGMMRSFCFFAPEERTGAVSSMLELAWPMYLSHPEEYFPSMKPFLCFFGLVLSPSEGKRTTWLKRIESNLDESFQSRCYPSIIWSHFGAAYNALIAKDESTFLEHATALEVLLERKPQEAGFLERWDMAAYRPVFPEIQGANDVSSPIELEYATTEQLEYNVYAEASPHVVHSSKHVNYSTPNIRHVPSSSESDEYTISAHSASSHDLVSSHYLDDYGNPYIPGEKLKTIYRIPLQLMRAEASLLFQDVESCISWVDEAERSMGDACYSYMLQRVFLMKNVIKDTCPFPSGTRSVVDEFERRVVAHDASRSATPHRKHTSIGALWRTP